MRNACRECDGPLVEIDRYGHRLVGCIDCNLWRWRDSDNDRMFMQLPEEDLQALSNLADARHKAEDTTAKDRPFVCGTDGVDEANRD
jgi:hypothetical protein